MGRFSGKALIERSGDNCKRFVVKRELTYYADDGRKFLINRGWNTDGASFPTRLLGCPYAGCYLEPALLHDVLYNSQVVSRLDADNLMLEAMKCNGVGWYTRTKIYVGVRSGGWAAWNKVSDARKEYFSRFINVFKKLA